MTAVSDTSVPEKSTLLGATGPLRPVPFVTPPARALPSFRSARAPWLWFLGAHGGAAESTLAELLPGAGAADHRWPEPADGSIPTVVLTARTSYAGLSAARAAATQWAARDTPPVHLLGLVLIADAPGRLSKPLRELAELVAGGVPRKWDLPWVEAWRVGARADQKVTARLFRDLGRLTESQEDPCTS